MTELFQYLVEIVQGHTNLRVRVPVDLKSSKPSLIRISSLVLSVPRGEVTFGGIVRR